MKRLIIIIFAFFVAHVFAQQPVNPWRKADEIVRAIGKVPLIETKVITISVEYAQNATQAINNAIEACNKAGGGKVVIPSGEFFTGPIVLLSNVNLHLEEGAVLKFSTNPKDYTPFVLTRWEGIDCYNYKPLIYAYKQKNIAITGKGILDGQADKTNWWPWKGQERYGWKSGMKSQHHNDDHIPGRIKLNQYNDSNVPVEKRVMLEDDCLRPPFIQPYECTNVLIEGVTIMNAPFWLIHPLLCKNVTIHNVRMNSPDGPNNDGCAPESCKNVLIDSCSFDIGNNCIAVKSGRNNDGRKLARPSENIVIRNCIMKDGHGGVVIGSEISGDCRNVFVENCLMDSPNMERVIRIKTNAVRGGLIEHIYIRNIKAGTCSEAIFQVEMKYEQVTEGPYLPIVRNVNLENITSRTSRYGVFIDGFDNGNYVSNISIKNCTFEGLKDPGLNKITGATNVTFQNTTITNDPTYKSVNTLREMTPVQRKRMAEQRRIEFLQQTQRSSQQHPQE